MLVCVYVCVQVIILGCALAVSFGAHGSEISTVDMLVDNFKQPATIAYLFVIFLLMSSGFVLIFVLEVRAPHLLDLRSKHSSISLIGVDSRGVDGHKLEISYYAAAVSLLIRMTLTQPPITP